MRASARVSRPLASVAFALAMLAIPTAGRAESGIVLDDSTGKPVEGVFVVATWRGSSVNPVHSSSGCYHLTVAVTDGDGRYLIDRSSDDISAFADRRRDVSFYKRGLEVVPEAKPGSIIRMRPVTKTVDERFEEDLVLRGRGCPDSETKLVPVAKAMAEEAMAIAEKNTKHMSIVSNLLFFAERVELGIDEAKGRQRARNQPIFDLERRAQ